MYQPGHGRFRVDDPAALLTELCAVVPATLVTHGPDGFRTTILPMLFDADDGPNGTLRGHLARGNPHWRELEAAGAVAGAGGAEAIAIFNGTDAYISPAWYEEKRATGKVVPTWNYVTVHVHGELVVHDDADWVEALVRDLTDRHESGRAEPWSVDDAPPEFVAAMVKGIVGVELEITRLEGKRKLSQNRERRDFDSTLQALDARGDTALADAMRRAWPAEK